MMRVIGADDKGNVIIEKTCSTGKTEEIILTEEMISAIGEFGKAAKAFQEIMQELMPAFRQLAEKCIRFLNAAQIQEKIRIRREAGRYQRKRCSRIRSRTRQQAKSTLKYKRYELRIYGRKERQGFYE